MKFDEIAEDKPRIASAQITLMRTKKGLTLMSITNVHERTTGFRELTNLELAIVSGGTDPLPGDDGPPIIVTGSPYSVSQDWLNLTNSSIGDFFEQLSDNNYDPFQDTTGDGGGETPRPLGEYSEEFCENALDANEDSEKQEAIEDFLESAFEQADPNQKGWVFEYNESQGVYTGIASDGRIHSVVGEQAESEFDSNVA